jgi:hypothetical protein
MIKYYRQHGKTVKEFFMNIADEFIGTWIDMVRQNNNKYIVLKRGLLFVFLLFFCVFINAEGQGIDVDKYQNTIFKIISNLDSIMENNQSSELVYNTYILAINAIRNNEVTFKIDPSLNGTLNGMNFTVYESGEISLTFGLKYLDTYYAESSVHYSILIHEYRHLHDYLKNKTAYINAKTNEKEIYWYELDALRIEAEFIKYYLAERYYLTKFEAYLKYSFEDNYLDTASIFLLKESMNVFFYFHNLETKYKENKITKEEIITDLEERGNTFISNYTDEEDDFINFIHYIEISSFRKYLIRLLTIIIDNPIMTWGEVFERYTEIAEIYEKMTDILSKYNNRQNQYIQFLYQYWEDDVVNRM